MGIRTTCEIEMSIMRGMWSLVLRGSGQMQWLKKFPLLVRAMSGEVVEVGQKKGEKMGPKCMAVWYLV